MACSICGTEHLLKTSPHTGEPVLIECVKALKGRIEALEEPKPAPSPAGDPAAPTPADPATPVTQT